MVVNAPFCDAPAGAREAYAEYSADLDRARAFYEIIIKRGEEVLAEVKSSWCCLNAETHRPARVSKSIIDHYIGKA